MTTGIVILNYNNAEDTINCIESVLKYNTSDIKIVIVDNGSPNPMSVRNIRSYLAKTFSDNSLTVNEGENIEGETLPFVTLLISKDNSGYAKGNNKGLELLYKDDEVDRIMILNNDILFIEDIIPQLNHYLDTLENAAIVSPLLLKKDKLSIDYNCARTAVDVNELIRLFLSYSLGLKGSHTEHKMLLRNPKLLNSEWFEIELPSGSCMLMSKEYFESIGSFDSNTFLYYEENILYEKVKHTGKKNYLIPNLRCVHLGASTTSKQVRTYPYLKKTNKSVRYFVKRYAAKTRIKKMMFEFVINLYLFRKYIAWNIIYNRKQ